MKIIPPDYKKIASEVKRREIEVTKDEIENLKLEKERIEKLRVRQKILEKIIQNSEIEIPATLILEEQSRILENLKKQAPQILQTSFEDYLARINKTEKELMDSLLPEAQKRIKNSLILREIGEREGIKVSEKEVEEEANKILRQNPYLAKEFDLEKLKGYTEEVLKNEKTLQFLESFAK